MARLIDADALIDFLDVGHLRHLSELCFSEIDVANLLLRAPTISPDEVRGVGEWINKTMSVPNGHGQTYNRWGCSKCKAKFKTRANYCPNCGARMEVSEDA